MTLPGPVLIVGAGIAGLALARRLAALGAEVHVVERRARDEAEGAGLLLTGNALRALRELGVERAVLAQSRGVRLIRFTDQREMPLFEVDLAQRLGWPAFVSIQRDALQRILLDAARPVQPRWETTLVSIGEGRDGVEVLLSDGTRGRYGLVVGADGVHSPMRALLFSAPRLEPIAGFRGWRFLAPCPPRLEAPQYMLGNGRTLLLHPLPGGVAYCGAGPVADEALQGADDLERLRNAFAEFAGCARAVLARVDPSTRLIATRYWHWSQQPWHAGSCVLIGDAAHPCAPTLAQGAAMALEDVVVLGESLARHAALEQALRAFEARRAPRMARVQALSLERMAANRPLDARALDLRNSVLSRIGADRLLDAWTPLMEGSP